MIKHFCDICGREITWYPSHPSGVILTIVTKGCTSETHHKEICWECAKKRTVTEIRDNQK